MSKESYVWYSFDVLIIQKAYLYALSLFPPRVYVASMCVRDMSDNDTRSACLFKWCPSPTQFSSINFSSDSPCCICGGVKFVVNFDLINLNSLIRTLVSLFFLNGVLHWVVSIHFGVFCFHNLMIHWDWILTEFISTHQLRALKIMLCLFTEEFFEEFAGFNFIKMELKVNVTQWISNLLDFWLLNLHSDMIDWNYPVSQALKLYVKLKKLLWGRNNCHHINVKSLKLSGFILLYWNKVSFHY